MKPTAEETEEDIAEQAKADIMYQEQRNKFRSALNIGNRKLAFQLSNEYNWPSDMVADELMDWLNDVDH